MISLRQLRYLEALARHRHFGHAADECAVSQPGLSQQIQELEARLGVGLIERTRGSIGLTPAGVEVVGRARSILTAVDDLVGVARQAGAPLTGPLRLGVIPSIAPYLLPAVLPLLQARHPALRLELRESQTRLIVDDLVDGRLDAVLIALPSGRNDLEERPLFDDPFVLASAADRRPGAPPAIHGILETERVLLLEEGHCLRDQALALCGATRPDLRAQLGATSLATVLQLVANGYGVTLLPDMSVAAETRNNPRVAVTRFAAPEPSRTIGLVWRRTSPRRRDYEALGALLTEAHEAGTASPVS